MSRLSASSRRRSELSPGEEQPGPLSPPHFPPCPCRGLGWHLKEIAPAARDDGPLLALVTVHHHHQVHVGILLPAAAVAPDPFHLVVHILRRDKRRGSPSPQGRGHTRLCAPLGPVRNLRPQGLESQS